MLPLMASLFGMFREDIGIDLGTANTLIYIKNKGIVVNEPTVVAINTRNNQILAVGREARDMIGKTPGYVITTRPLAKGIIADFEVAERMLRYYLDRIGRGGFGLGGRSRVVIGIPLQITEVERKAVEDAVLGAGAGSVFLIEEPMAAAVGSGLPVEDPVGNMIVDIGGGTTDMAVISLGGIVNWKSLTTAGDEQNRNIIHYAREQFNLLIGERVAETIKIEAGSATSLDAPLEVSMRGRDLISGLPKEILISDGHIREALKNSVQIIVESVKEVLEKTPPELVADIFSRGVVLSGGGALLRNLDRLIALETEIPVRIATDPLTSVVRGAGLILDNEELLDIITVPSARE